MSDKVTAAILAGGKSRRMGFDKASARIGGTTLLSRTTRVARDAGVKVLVAGRAKPADWAEEAMFAPDGQPGLGPLGGLAAALREVGGPVLALACDMPLLTPDAIRWLLAEAHGKPLKHGLITMAGDRYEPLFSLYTQACLPLVEARLAGEDLSLKGLIAAGQFAFTQAPGWLAEQLKNVNTPEDFERLKVEIGGGWPVENNPATRTVKVQRVRGQEIRDQEDLLAVEEPLEIRLGFEENGRRVHRSLSITMRTPGQDCELAAGFLFTEGIVHSPEQIAKIAPCGKPIGNPPICNTVRADLAGDTGVDFGRLTRHFYTSSSCGVCGKSSIDALRAQSPYELTSGPVIDARVISLLPQAQRDAQEVFEQTGGLHASALFDISGKLLDLCEDVGRHNALDKLIGRRFLAGNLPVSDHILLVSGRASFELVQKALMAGIPIVAAIGAPSSLAVELAKDGDMTLVGFLRDDRFNLYCGGDRIKTA